MYNIIFNLSIEWNSLCLISLNCTLKMCSNNILIGCYRIFLKSHDVSRHSSNKLITPYRYVISELPDLNLISPAVGRVFV